jgi:hypothetical protein
MTASIRHNKVTPKALAMFTFATLLAGSLSSMAQEQPSVQKATVFIMVDVTASTQAFHGRFLGFTKQVLLVFKDKGHPVMLNRLCGVTELVADAPGGFTRKNFAAFSAALKDSLASCNPTTTRSPANRGGSNLGAAIDAFLNMPDDTIGVLVTDGLSFPLSQADFYKKLKSVPKNRRANLFVAGLDEGVFSTVKSLLPTSTCNLGGLGVCVNLIKSRLGH